MNGRRNVTEDKRNKGNKRNGLTLSMLLVLLILGTVCFPVRAFAKASVSTNVKGTYTLTKSKTMTLYVKNAGRVIWKSSNTAVAYVNSAGKVTAKAAGSAKITARASGKNYTCTIKVVSPVTTNVRGTVTLKKGSTVSLYVKNAGKVTWKSSKTSVATVSSAGKVTAKAAGSTTITAKASGKTYTCTVKVTSPQPVTTTSKTNTSSNLGLNTNGMNSTDAALFKKMYALHKTLPEGMSWTAFTSYRWKGGIFSIGYGCSSFAFRVSDEAFGSAPATIHYNFYNVKVGDILRINSNTHSVIVLKIVGDNFVVAEGNYNGTVHWGRVLTRSAARAGGTYVMTRR